MEEKKPNTPRNSTVAVSPEIGKKLERFCASCGITKKDFISLSLDYFQRYGINPVKHESPAQEMQTLIKRVNQIVAFIRKQEQEALRPLCEATAVANTHIENVLSDLFFVVKRFEGNMDVWEERFSASNKLDEQERRLNELYEKIENVLGL